jgi:hypothetical protein
MKARGITSLLAAALSALGCAMEEDTTIGEEVGEEVGEGSAELSGSTTIDNTSTSGPVAAVGRLFSPSGTCSGTVIARGVVLTAGHCLDDNPPPASVTFCLPQTGVPCTASDRGGFLSAATSFSVLANGSDRPHDLAIVKLAIPVPTSVLQTIPPVFLGNAKVGVDSAATVLPGVLVGLGRFDPNQGSDGNRRFAAAPPLFLAKDPCDSLVEGHCNDDDEFEALIPVLPAQPQRGDSGGPLYLSTSAGMTVVGVLSGEYGPEPPLGANARSWVVWAPTGDVGGASNAAFILNGLGGDADGDSIPEALDNCPATRCAGRPEGPASCANADQRDADGDGVGEVCDNCPKSVCDALPGKPGISCANSLQANSDGDAFGDRCDLCPETRGSILLTSFQKDDDGDGVGDECDLCAASDPYPSCTAATGCVDGVCRVDPSGATAFCSRPPDADNDEVGDACDTCGGQVDLRQNSNPLAEARESRAALDDQCDAVPLVRVEPQRPVSVPFLSTPGDDRGPEDVEVIEANRWLGRNGPTSPTRQFNQGISFLHCSCFDPATGLPLSLEECVGEARQCNWRGTAANDRWRRMTIVDETGAPILGADGYTSPQQFTTQTSLDFTRLWRWRRDAAAGRVASQGNCASGSDCRTHGAILTTVRNESGAFISARDLGGVLRDVFSLHQTPFFKVATPATPRDPSPSDICRTSRACVFWFNPHLLRDPVLVGDFGSTIKNPVVLRPGNGRVDAIVGSTVAIDVTASLSPGLRQQIGNGQIAWLPPVEPSARIKASAVTSFAQAAVLSRSFQAQSTPGLVIQDGGGLFLAGEEQGFGPPAQAVLAGGPAARTGVQGVYSALEGAVYMVGGLDAQQQATGAIWRFAAAERSWTLVNPNAREVPSSTVLAVAYDQTRRSMYVLDVDDDDQVMIGPTVLRRARLYRLDVGSGRSTLLGVWPYASLFETVTMTAMEDGQLAVVTGGPTSYLVTRLLPLPLGVLVTGVAAGSGRVIDQPIMGDHHPVLPLIQNNQFAYVTLSPDRFFPGNIWSSL